MGGFWDALGRFGAWDPLGTLKGRSGTLWGCSGGLCGHCVDGWMDDADDGGGDGADDDEDLRL